MTYPIAIVVFLALPAFAVAARMAARHYYGPHGRSDVEWGRTGELSSAASMAYNNALRQARAEASATRTSRRDRPATLKPVFHIGATPAPEGVSPRVSDEDIRREFDLNTPDRQGRAA